MASVLTGLQEGARVLVIRLRSLGDCVLTTPALALLKQYRPDVHVGVVAEKAFAAVFEGISPVNEIVRPGVRTVARWRADLCLNLHGGGRSMALTTASGARFRAGFAHFRGARIYNVRIPRAQEILGEERTVHTAEHLASAMFHLGVPRTEIPRAMLYAQRLSPMQPYAVIHPMASAPDKVWPAENFLAVARHMEVQWSIEPVFIAGAGEDLRPFARYRTMAGATLEKIKNLIANAVLFAGNDSGPAHIAAAFGVPVAVLFGPSNPEIWRPWRTQAAVFHAPDGLATVTPQEVIKALGRFRENPQGTLEAAGPPEPAGDVA